MTYKEWVYNEFREDHDARGMCSEDIEDIIELEPFEAIERWMLRQGYDLKGDWRREQLNQ